MKLVDANPMNTRKKKQWQFGGKGKRHRNFRNKHYPEQLITSTLKSKGSNDGP